jgi:electron transport complex protein RnfG
MKNNNFKMVIVLTLISIVAALILSTVYSVTKEPIAEAYRQEFVKGLTIVLPKFDNEPDREFKTVGDRKIYVAKKGDKIVGYALRASSMKGYSGLIEVLIGIDTTGKVIGIEILKHAETPGLGSKIESSWFKKEFVGLTAKDNIAVKKDGGQIDQFSGATISPRAVCEAVSSGLKFLKQNISN